MNETPAIWLMPGIVPGSSRSDLVEGRPGEVTRVFVGHPHPQTDRYIEVIAAQHGNDFVIFHVMPLSDLYRHLLRRDI